MKPITKFQVAMCELHERLPNITKEQIAEAYSNIFADWLTISRNRFFCMECGHKWKPENISVKKCTCPSCNKELHNVEKQSFTRNLYTIGSTLRQDGHFNIVTVVEGVQVVRTIYVCKEMNRGKLPSYSWTVVSNHLTTAENKSCVFSRISSSSYVGWSLTSTLELRSYGPNDPYALVMVEYVCKDVKVLPILKRNGFLKKDLLLLDHAQLHIYNLLTKPQYETLIKAKQYPLAKSLFKSSKDNRLDKYWSTIKIALRNNYKIKDPSMWFDLLWVLLNLKKDLHNAKFVCPQDLKQAHNQWKELFQIKQAKERAAAKAKRLEDKAEKERLRLQAIKEYPGRMEKFSHLFFTNGTIEITPIMTVEEMELEGKELYHCVHTNEYYSEKDSLILSAKINGVRVETIEVKLDTFTVEQSRGYDNKATKYNEEIVNLVEKNMKLIKKAYRGQKIKQPLKLAS